MRLIDGKDLADTLLGEIFDRGQESAKYEDMLEIGAMTYREEEWMDGFSEGLNYVYRMIENAPTIEAVPVRHGHWIDEIGMILCSECGDSWGTENEEMVRSFNFCPNCGAKMDEKERDEDA